jgi:hypothetical protein
MLPAKMTPDRFETILDLIEEKLLNDRAFRKAFFDDSVTSLENLGIKQTPEIAEFIKDLEWPLVEIDVANFDEKLVLCSSSGY